MIFDIYVVQTVMLATFLAAIGYFSSLFIIRVMERNIERQGQFKEVVVVIARRARLEMGLDSRRSQLTSEAKTLEREIRNLVKERQAMEEELRLAAVTREVLMRLVGDEVEGNYAFIAEVVNRAVTPAKANQERRVTQIDASWAVPQLVEIWAPTLSDAKLLLEKRFPPSVGFGVIRLSPSRVPQSADPGQAAAS